MRIITRNHSMSQFFSGYLTAVFTFVLLCTASRLVGYVIKKDDSAERQEQNERLTVIITNQELIISILNKNRFESGSFDSIENKFRGRSRSNSVPNNTNLQPNNTTLESNNIGTPLGVSIDIETANGLNNTEKVDQNNDPRLDGDNRLSLDNDLVPVVVNTEPSNNEIAFWRTINFLFGMKVSEARKVLEEKEKKLNIVCITVGNMTSLHDRNEEAINVRVEASSFDDVESGMIVGILSQ